MVVSEDRNNLTVAAVALAQEAVIAMAAFINALEGALPNEEGVVGDATAHSIMDAATLRRSRALTVS